MADSAHHGVVAAASALPPADVVPASSTPERIQTEVMRSQASMTSAALAVHGFQSFVSCPCLSMAVARIGWVVGLANGAVAPCFGPNVR